MKAVVNSSMLIALSSIGQLGLLKHRFTNGVLIPDAVWYEVVETGGGRPGAKEVQTAFWIRRCRVQDQDYVRLLCTELDAGEAEAIALAREEAAVSDQKSPLRGAGGPPGAGSAERFAGMNLGQLRTRTIW